MSEGNGRGSGVFLRAGDVAKRFHVSPKTVARWATEGKIRYVRTLGGHRRFPDTAVQELIDRLAAEDRSGVTD